MHTNPALPSQSLIQTICYTELNKVFSKAVIHGCKHEASAISAYETVMQKQNKNFKVEKCGMFINKNYPWLHATPDFLCSCDCCGMECGEVKCPFCIEICEQYVQKRISCLKKGEDGNMFLNPEHAYYYQVQQQLFTVDRIYCDFVVCAFDHTSNGVKFFVQRILPNEAHWQRILPKLEQFWRICILPEVSKAKPCTDEKLLEYHGTSCQSGKYFHLACLRYKKMLKNSQSTWKCPSCCKSSKVVKNSKNSNDYVITLVKNHVQTPLEKCNPIGELTEEHFDIIRSPTGR